MVYNMENRGKLAKYLFLHHCIRADIVNGKIPFGSTLPSKRHLAQELKVSVNTVERAYSLLVSEGYIEPHAGSGFTVCLEQKQAHKFALFQDEIEAGEETRSTKKINNIIDLKANRSSLELFPLDTWSRLMRQVLSGCDLSILETVPFNGLLVLRKAIASFLYETKGICVSPSRIIIGAGTEYLYSRLLQLLGNQCIIAIEDPGYKKFADISRSFGTLWKYIPLDEQGILVSALSESRSDVVHVSPANQFPMGLVMSKSRRKELLAWLHESPNRYLIEDDYDSEIRYAGTALPPLITQDDTQRVIYLNTFSKTLVPSLRISYMILPDTLMDLYRKQLSFYSCTVSSFEQYTLAKFISEGYLQRHIKSLRRHYKQRRQAVFEAFQNSKIATCSSIFAGDIGTHFILRVETKKTEEEIHREAKKRNANIALLSDYCANPTIKEAHCIVVNFASISILGIRQAVELLEDIFSEEIALQSNDN